MDDDVDIDAGETEEELVERARNMKMMLDIAREGASDDKTLLAVMGFNLARLQFKVFRQERRIASLEEALKNESPKRPRSMDSW